MWCLIFLKENAESDGAGFADFVGPELEICGWLSRNVSFGPGKSRKMSSAKGQCCRGRKEIKYTP